MQQKLALRLLSSILLVVGVSALLFVIEQDEFPYILLAYSVTFLGFYGIVKAQMNLTGILMLALILRSLALFSFPALSDDIYRYIWDGLQWSQGNNPFAYLPSQQLNPSGFEEMLIRLMNSPDYHSIYPPVLQLLFYGVTECIPTPLVKQTFLLKTILLFIEVLGIIATFFLLKKWKLPLKKAGLYLLNPLIVVELLGNIHLEVIMISFLAISLLCFSYKKNILGAMLLSLSVLSKLTTLLVLPFLYKKLPFKEFIKVAFVSCLAILGSFYLMLSGALENFMMSLNLYFQKFEFNAGIYFLFRYIGKSIVGYNPIYVLGPLLSGISAAFVLYLVYKSKRSSSILNMLPYVLLALSAYFLLSTTVHPWYIATLVFLSMFTQFKYAHIWSFLAIFSYSLYYLEGEYYYVFVTLEYLILAIVIYQERKGIYPLLLKP